MCARKNSGRTDSLITVSYTHLDVYKRQEYPACAICHAASEPARPAPITVTVCLFSIFLPRVVLIERVSAARRYAVERLGFVFFL